MHSIAVMSPAKEPFILINRENKAVFQRKINPTQATGGEIAFSVYLNGSGPGPEPGQESRSTGAVLQEISFGVCSVCVFVFNAV